MTAPVQAVRRWAREVRHGTGVPASRPYRRARLAAVALQVAREKVVTPLAYRYGDVPATPADVTPEWLTAALCRGIADARVEWAKAVPHSAGSSTRWQIQVRYNAAGEKVGLPSTVFAKTTAAYRQRIMLGFIGNISGEPTFFRDFRPRLDIEAPLGYYGAFDPVSWRSISLIEDLVHTKGAEFLVPARYVTRDEMVGLLDQMAAWHGRFWNSPEVRPLVNAPADYVGRAGDFFGWEGIARLGAERGSAVIPSALAARTVDHLEPMLAGLRLLGRGPVTLLHGDPHIGNTYVTGEGRMGFTDWQCVLRGSWAYDVSYLLAGGLTVEDRRAWERDLLEHYLHRLDTAGGEPPTSEEAWTAYRQQALWPYYAWLSTIGHGALQPDMQPDEVSLDMVARTAAAVEDHEPVALLRDAPGIGSGRA
ncbi:phosphotransferase [Streptomyces sp. NPDC002346]